MGVFQRRGYLLKRRTNLKTSKVLVKSSFDKSEWKTDCSNEEYLFY